MIHYRAFRNGDTPALAKIWRTQPRERGLMQPMSAVVLEEMVLSKLYFDNAGLIVAEEDGEPVGFAHAGFGPNEDRSRLSYATGVIYLVMVRSDYQKRGIGRGLLEQAEAYLTARGAKTLRAGGMAPWNGFYLGLYGGCELPGVLDSAPHVQQLLLASGYQAADRTFVLRRDLAGFRPPIDHRQLQVRRRCNVCVQHDPPAATWWEACTYGALDRTSFELNVRGSSQRLATANFWPIEPLAASWGVQAAGLLNLEVDAAHRREGLGAFLLSEVLKHYQSQCVATVETLTTESDQAARGLFERLGFREVDRGMVFVKQAAE